MTLSLFEDSGWYTVNYEAGLTEGEFLFGNGEAYHSLLSVVQHMFIQMKDVIL